MAEAGSAVPPLNKRPVKNTVCLFDVDGTLTPARRVSLSSISGPVYPNTLDTSSNNLSIRFCTKTHPANPH